jgi:hypothetical protein
MQHLGREVTKMTTKAKTRKAPRRVSLVEQFRDTLANVTKDAEKSVRSVLNTIESRTTSLERTIRQRLARTLREVGKQLRRVERAVAPGPAVKARAPAKKKTAVGTAAKRVARSVDTSLAA